MTNVDVNNVLVRIHDAAAGGVAYNTSLHELERVKGRTHTASTQCDGGMLHARARAFLHHAPAVVSAPCRGSLPALSGMVSGLDGHVSLRQRRTSAVDERRSGFPRVKPSVAESGHRGPERLGLHHVSAMTVKNPCTIALQTPSICGPLH